jgi:protein CpxP
MWKTRFFISLRRRQTLQHSRSIFKDPKGAHKTRPFDVSLHMFYYLSIIRAYWPINELLQFFTRIERFLTIRPPQNFVKQIDNAEFLRERVVGYQIGVEMKKVIIAVVALLLVVGAGIFVIAQKGGGRTSGGPAMGRGMGHGMGGQMMLRGLDLSDEQKAKVKEIMDASRSKAEPLHQSMKAAQEKLQQATAGGAFDEAQVSAIANELGGLHAQMIIERQRTKSQIFAILTDEQKAKASEMKGKMMDGFKGRHRRSGDMPMGTEF